MAQKMRRCGPQQFQAPEAKSPNPAQTTGQKENVGTQLALHSIQAPVTNPVGLLAKTPRKMAALSQPVGIHPMVASLLQLTIIGKTSTLRVRIPPHNMALLSQVMVKHPPLALLWQRAETT